MLRSSRLTQPQDHTPSLDARLAALAGRQHGIVTLAQLLALGLTRSGVSRRVARGALHRLHRGVYAVGFAVPSRDGAWMAAVLAAGPGGALSHRSAGELHGVSRLRAPVITVSTPAQRAPRGVRVHRVRRLDPRDITTERRIPVTTVHRLLVDLTDAHTPHQIANVIHEAAFRGRFVEAAVRDCMARANGRRNLHVLERAIALHRAGSAGTRSGAEDAFLALVEEEPLVNVGLLGFEVDFHWPHLRLAVEIDGGGHARRPTLEADKRRDAALAAAGYTLLRFSDRDVYERPGEVRAALRSCSVAA